MTYDDLATDIRVTLHVPWSEPRAEHHAGDKDGEQNIAVRVGKHITIYGSFDELKSWIERFQLAIGDVGVDVRDDDVHVACRS